MHRILLLLCVVRLLCFGQAANFGYYAARVEVEGRYWAPDASPELKIGTSVLNEGVRFGPDLGTGNPRLPDIRFTVRRGNHRIQAGFARFTLDGDQNVSRTIGFGGRVYTVGTRVVTHADVSDFKVGWSYALVRAGDGVFKLGPLVEGHALWWDASLTAPLAAVSARDKRTVGFPTVGLALEAMPHRRVSIFAEASGITAGDYGRFYNAEAGLRVSPAAHLGFTGGFRVFDLYPKFNGDYARLRLAGPFVGAVLGF